MPFVVWKERVTLFRSLGLTSKCCQRRRPAKIAEPIQYMMFPLPAIPESIIRAKVTEWVKIEIVRAPFLPAEEGTE